MSNNDIALFLNKFINPSHFLLNTFIELIECVEFNPGDFLVKEKEFNPHFYIIKQGIVRSYLLNTNGKEATRALFIPGDIAGANSAVMQNTPSELNYQALTKVTAYKGSLVSLRELALKHHEFSKLYVKTLEEAYLKAETAVISVATLNAEERYLALQKKIPNIDAILTQKHIASYLNVTTVQLSRIKKVLSISK